MRTPPPEAPFSSYGTKTIITGTTFTRSIRSLHANTPAGGSVFKLRHQDHHLQTPPSSDLSDPTCEHPRRRLRFQVTAPRPSPLTPPSPDLSDSYMRTPPPEAPFSSYGTKTITTDTTFIRSIRFLHANTPAGGSVFKLRHQDHHYWHHLHQIYQIPTCEHPRRRLRFQVTAPRPSPLTPPSSDLSDSTCEHPRRRLRFQVTAPRPSLLAPPSIHQILSNMRTPLPEAPFSSYGTKTIITGTTFIRSIRSLHANTPAGGSVFKLRHQDHHY